jgi:hypothetical protein
MDDRAINDSTDGRIEAAKDAALGRHGHASTADEVSEAAGGISGVLAGAAIGSVGGPVGTLIGGIAGALGGWWTARAISEAAERLTEDDDTYYRLHYESSPMKLADRSYEDVRPAYHLGHVAAYNPDYASKSWTEVQNDLQRAWSAEQAKRYGEFSAVSGYASEGFVHGKSVLGYSTSRTFDPAENSFDRAATEAEKKSNAR